MADTRYELAQSAFRHHIDVDDTLHAIDKALYEFHLDAEPPQRPDTGDRARPHRIATGNRPHSDRYCIPSDSFDEAAPGHTGQISMSTTAPTAPKPTPETPLYPYGTMLADAGGYLYDTDGTAVTLKGRHLTTTELEAAADDCESGL